MHVITICDTNPEWLDFHLYRFIRLARRAMPTATYHALIVAPYGPEPNAKTHKALKLFDDVRFVLPQEQVGYLYFNALRYSLLERFGLDECLYVDPDVDIFADLSDIPKQPESLLWCRSPVEPDGMGALVGNLELGGRLTDGNGEVWPNSGMLYMRRDFLDEYEKAAALVHQSGYNPRMIGNAAFMVMCRMLEDGTHAEMPYLNDVIWWEQFQPQTMVEDGRFRATAYAAAKAVHYCNDQGKACRKDIDAGWVYKD